MKKKLLLLTAAAMTLMLSACGGGGDGGTVPGGKTDPFNYQNSMIRPELNIDGRQDEELWKGDDVAHLKFSSCDVSVLRRPDAVYVFYKVFDITPYRYISEGAADEVTYSDSVEIYFDAGLGRTEKPQVNCYQINLARDGRTRIMSAAGGVWVDWAGMYMFEVREGFNDEYDYYYVEAMIPIAQLGASENSDMGIAFGLVDRTVDENKNLLNYYTWTGVTYNSVACDPQHPNTYLVLPASGGKIISYAEYLADKKDKTPTDANTEAK